MEDEEGERLKLGELFAEKREFPQRELVEAGERGLYDFVQVDSEVEEQFLQRVKEDKNVVLFFKFPSAFKVQLPRLIGNYNPDWGIVRRRDDGKLIIHLVRETKGGEIDALRFPHEKRKVRCAQAYFEALEMDYRQIQPDFKDWWMLTEEVGKQRKIRS